MNSPAFIVSAPRSGTTLLRRMLVAHSSMAGPHEYPLVQNALAYFSRPGMAEDVGPLLDFLFDSAKFRSWGLSREEIEGRLSGHPGLDARIFLVTVMEAYLRREGASTYIDKNIGNIAILPQIKALFPEARFIFINRDGRDVAASLIEKRWESYVLPPFPRRYPRHPKGGALLWLDAVHLIESFQACYSPSSVTISYEDLVGSPVATLSRVCEFLGVRFEATMLEYYRSEDPTIPHASVRANHPLVVKPLTGAQCERYAHDLAPAAIASINQLTRRELMELGYPVSPGRPNPWFHAGYVLQQALASLRRAIRGVMWRRMHPDALALGRDRRRWQQ